MQISSQISRPAMRSGASSVASAKRHNPQAAASTQTQAIQTSSTDSTKQKSSQLQAQLLNVGSNIDYTA